MTETTDAVSTRTGSLSTLRLAELQQLATSMGIPVSAKMRKADLVSAIREERGASSRPTARSSAAPQPRREESAQQPARNEPAEQPRRDESSAQAAPEKAGPEKAGPESAASPTGAPETPDGDPDLTDSIQAALDRAQAQRDEVGS